MIAIVDYGVGNLFSLYSSFGFIGEKVIVAKTEQAIRDCDRIILPGVGAFGDAMDKLCDSGLSDVIVGQARAGKPLLGICLGMQLLFDESSEYGRHEGLGLIGGKISPIADSLSEDLCLKIPHIGWNALSFSNGVEKKEKNELFKYCNEGDHVYFVHSYYGTECERSMIATTEYGAILTAAVADGNVYGTQFHPEKSGHVGLGILKAFCEL